MPTVRVLAARAALDDFFTANPKVAGLLAACADAGLTACATREVIVARGLVKEARRAFRLAKDAAGPLDFGSHSSLESPGLPGRSTPFRAPDAPGSFDAAKAPRLPAASGMAASRPPADPSPSWGDLGGDYARRLYTGAKGGLTAALGTGARAVTGIGQGAVGAANWATGTPSEQSPWANYLSGAQESLGQFAGAGAQNVANAFNSGKPPTAPDFDPLAQQHTQHQQWADQAFPGEWNNLPGQASHVGGVAATAAMTGKALTPLAPVNALNQAAGPAAASAARTLGSHLKGIPAGVLYAGATGAGGAATMHGLSRLDGGGPADQGAPQAPQFPDTVDLDVSQMTPQHAQEYTSNGMQGFSDTIQRLKLEDPNQPGWRQKAVPELAGPLRSMVVGVAALTKKNPRELFEKVMADGPQAVDFDHLRTIATMPGNEALAQPTPDKPPAAPESMGQPPPNAPGAPPQQQQQGAGLLGGSNPVQAAWSFLNNDQISPWARAGVAVGVPLAVIGALSGLLGEGGIGSLLMTVFGVGSALAGAHTGGLADLGKAFGTLTGGWGAQNPAAGGGAQPGQPPGQATPPGQPAASAFPSQLTPEHLGTWGAMAPQDRMNAILPQGLGANEQVQRLTALSKAYDPDQLSGLLSGADPQELAQTAQKIQAAPEAGGWLGMLPGVPAIDPAVKQELLQAIQQRQLESGLDTEFGPRRP